MVEKVIKRKKEEGKKLWGSDKYKDALLKEA